MNNALPATAPESPTSHFKDSIHDLLVNWDRASFGVACRRMEVLLLRGDNQRAVGVLYEIIRRQSREVPGLQSPLCHVLPERTACLLESAGYTSLTACHKATDEQLMTIENIGSTTVDLIRETVRCVMAGHPLPYTEDHSDLEPDWDLSISINQTEGKRIVSKVKEALSVLLESQGEALAEIDGEIASLTSDIENLKRMRKLLAPSGKTKSASGSSKAGGDYKQLAERIVPIVRQHGPLRPKAIAELIGEANFGYIGRCVVNCPELLTKTSDGLITLANAV